MGKGSKKTPADAGRLMRRIVAENIRLHMDTRFATIRTKTEREKKLAEKAGVSASTIQRILAQEVGPSIDTIEDIAKVLKVPAPSLFVASDEMRAAMDVRHVDTTRDLHRLPGRDASR